MKIHIAIADSNPAYAHRLGRALENLSGGTYAIVEWTPEKISKNGENIQENEQGNLEGLMKESNHLDVLILDAQFWKKDKDLWKRILEKLDNFSPKKKMLLWKGDPDWKGDSDPLGTPFGDKAWEGPTGQVDPFAPVSQIFQVLEDGLRQLASLLPADEDKQEAGFMVVSAFDPGLRRQFIRKKLREYAKNGESCLYLPFLPIFDLQLPLAVVGPDYEEPDAPDHMGLSTALLAWENGLVADQQILLHTIKPYALDIGSYYGPKLNGRAEDILQCKPETLVQCAKAYAQMMKDLDESSHCLIEVHLPLSHLIPLVRAADRFYCDFPAGSGTADFFARQELRLFLADLPDSIKVIELKYIVDRKTREEYFEEKKRRNIKKKRWFAR